MYTINKEAVKTVEDVVNVLDMLGILLMDDHPLVEQNKHLLLKHTVEEDIGNKDLW